MDIGFDQKAWRNGAAGEGSHPDWHVLRARLDAAITARRAMEEAAAAQAGSFDSHGAHVLAQYAGSLTDVNPVSSAVRNSECGIETGLAGTCPTGGRG